MLQLQQRARSLHIEIFRLFSFANIFLITKASFQLKIDGIHFYLNIFLMVP